MRTVLDVVGRPEPFRRPIVPPVEQGLERLADDCFILLFHSLSHWAYGEARSGPGSFLDRIDPIGVEGEMVLDDGYCSVRCFVAPYGIDRALAADGDAEICGATIRMRGERQSG